MILIPKTRSTIDFHSQDSNDWSYTSGNVSVLQRRHSVFGPVWECYLDVGGVLVGILDMWEPVSGRFGEVFGLCDEPQHLGPALDTQGHKTNVLMSPTSGRRFFNIHGLIFTS